MLAASRLSDKNSSTVLPRAEQVSTDIEEGVCMPATRLRVLYVTLFVTLDLWMRGQVSVHIAYQLLQKGARLPTAYRSLGLPGFRPFTQVGVGCGSFHCVCVCLSATKALTASTPHGTLWSTLCALTCRRTSSSRIRVQVTSRYSRPRARLVVVAATVASTVRQLDHIENVLESAHLHLVCCLPASPRALLSCQVTTRDSTLMQGATVHTEYIDRDAFSDKRIVEPYRLPAHVYAARVRLHVGTEAPCSCFIGRPVFEGLAYDQVRLE